MGGVGLSHLMIAGWDTDAGQRVGAAAEIEGALGGGGGGDVTPPPAPTNLRLSVLQKDLLMARIRREPPPLCRLALYPDDLSAN